MMRLEKWYMILEGPEYKEGFAYTDPCSKENLNEIALVRYSSYERACFDRDDLFKENQKLKAQLEKAESVIDFYSDSDNWEHKSPVQADYVVILDDSGTGEFQLNHMTDDDRVGGRRAREYFKEKEQV